MEREKENKAALFFVGIMVIIVLSGIGIRYYKEYNAFQFRNHLTETAVTIDGTFVTLGEMSYYIAMVEQEFQSMAIAYNPGNPEDFWNTHFKNLENSKFTNTYAKEVAGDLCVYDYIMAKEAEKKGFELSEEQRKECQRMAVDFYYRLSYEAVENTGVTIENLLPMVERNELVKEYVTATAENIKKQDAQVDVSGLNYDGDYYQTVIMPQYSVEFNSSVWDEVKMGTITVNVEE